VKHSAAIVSAAILVALANPVAARSNISLVDPTLGNSGAQALAGRGVGGQASLTLRFGAKRAADTLRLGLAAGPVMRFTGASARDSRLVMNTLLGVSVNPGYSTRLSFAGADIARYTTRLGAAEDEAQGKKRGGPSTLGWVAIGVGAVVVGVVALAAVCADTDVNCLNSD